MRGGILTIGAGFLLSGCSLIRVDVPAETARPTCLPMADIPTTERQSVAAELDGVASRDPDAVTPKWIADYLKLRAANRVACSNQD